MRKVIILVLFLVSISSGAGIVFSKATELPHAPAPNHTGGPEPAQFSEGYTMLEKSALSKLIAEVAPAYDCRSEGAVGRYANIHAVSDDREGKKGRSQVVLLNDWNNKSFLVETADHKTVVCSSSRQ